jgi:hypothetical protein
MKTYDNFYSEITDDERTIVDKLREVVLAANPNFKEKISYGVPYYFLHTRVCFIWPASIHPGPKSGVMLGFCQGYLLSDEYGVLDRENRKVIGTLIFHDASEIELDIIRSLLDEAILVDHEMERMKETKLKRKGNHV